MCYIQRQNQGRVGRVIPKPLGYSYIVNKYYKGKRKIYVIWQCAYVRGWNQGRVKGALISNTPPHTHTHTQGHKVDNKIHKPLGYPYIVKDSMGEINNYVIRQCAYIQGEN